MLKSIAAILLFLAIAYFQIPQLLKEKMIKEIWIFSILMIFLTGVSVAKLNNVPLPSPLDLITIIFKPFIS